MMITNPIGPVLASIALALGAGVAITGPQAIAHEGPTPQHYVASDGVDEGACDDGSAPCRTIAYALSQAEKGDTVLIASGTYAFEPDDPAEVVQLLSPLVDVVGGYGTRFAEQDVAGTPTILIGPSVAYADALEARGLLVQTQPGGTQAAPIQAETRTLAQAGSQDSQPLLAAPETLYVVPNGVSEGDCSIDAPCALEYALARAAPGSAVLVAGGDYVVAQDSTDALIRSDINLRGGYLPDARFAAAAPAARPSYITGPSFDMRQQLAERGLTLVQDRKGLAIDEAIAGSALAPVDQVLGFTPCDPTTGIAGPYPCKGVDHLAHMPLAAMSSRPEAANDIWGFVDQRDQREYALLGLLNGTAVIDVTDPRAPREVGTIRGQNAKWRDIKVFQFRDETGAYKSYAYVTADFPAAPQGLQIIDLSGLPDTISLAATYDGFSRAHNIYLSNTDYTTGMTLPGMEAFAFILGSDRGAGAAHALSLRNPIAPQEVLTPIPGTQYAHDAASAVITDGRTRACRSGANPPPTGHNPCELLVDFNENTLDLWDVTDKNRPLLLSSTTYQDASYTHSGWVSNDTRFVFVQDELDEQNRGLNTTVRTFDISDLTAPKLTKVWSGPERNIDHNGFVFGDKYYMSAYRRGLMVLDIANPNDPVEIAFFDTFPSPVANTPFFNGAWGVYPFLPSGTLLVSNIESGLFVLRESAGKEPGPSPKPEAEIIAYEYPVKFVCGIQNKEESEQLVPGVYGTVINIANLNDRAIKLEKRIALTLPPGKQEPGRTGQLGADTLPAGEALKTDCGDIVRTGFDGNPPAGVFEGFVVVRSEDQIEVSAVYAASALEAGERLGGDIDVQQPTPRLVRKER